MVHEFQVHNIRIQQASLRCCAHSEGSYGPSPHGTTPLPTFPVPCLLFLPLTHPVAGSPLHPLCPSLSPPLGQPSVLCLGVPFCLRSLFCCFGFHLRVRSRGILLSRCGLSHLARHTLGPPMLLQMAGLTFYFPAEAPHPLRPFVRRRAPGLLAYPAIVKNARNSEVCVSLCIGVLAILGRTPSRATAGS